jgi:hypothetical protein
MRVLKESDVKTFEQLCGLTQMGLKKTLSKFLRSKYDKIIETKDYLLAEGDIPIALVAHMDTVFPKPPTDIFYDRVKNVMLSPTGLGADDRAGVFAIIQIIRRGLRPHIIFTTDEESGCVGASKLANIKCPFADLRYLIQLDRRNACDCVFYDCDNKEFVQYVETFGFVENYGTFSDISMICPAWKIAGVNLSIGYYNEHSTGELLYIGQMLTTIERVVKMLQEKEIPSFEYIESAYSYNKWYRHYTSWSSPSGKHTCTKCKKEFLAEELIPVKGLDEYLKYYCIDCISDDNVDWCKMCGDAYEIDPNKKNTSGVCEDCLYDYFYPYH